MRPEPEMIRLGAREWLVRPLTLAQVQAIEPVLLKTQEGAGTVAAAASIVSIALTRDHTADAETLMEVEATAPELATAMTAVLRLAGFIDTRQGEPDAQGESEADATKMPSASA